MISLEAGREPVPGFYLLEFLGKGQFGEVWLAEGHGRKKVALKFLQVQGASGLKEFKAISWIKEIQHPNLLPITGAWLLDHRGKVMDSALLDDPSQLEHGSHRNQPTVLVVAMVAGDKSLAQVHRDYVNTGEDGIPAVELLTYVDDAARGLDFLSSPRHDFGEGQLVAIQHRDVKPENILLIGDVAVVCDFGVARTMDSTALTATGMIGSPAFMAPECIEGKQTSLTTDQYSLALTYYYLRSGAMPFPENATAMTALNCHMTGNLDLSCVSEEELHVLKQATHLDPRSRFETCRAMVNALEVAVSDTREPPLAAAPLKSNSTPASTSLASEARSESIARSNQTLAVEEPEEQRGTRENHSGGQQIEGSLSDTDGSNLNSDTVPDDLWAVFGSRSPSSASDGELQLLPIKLSRLPQSLMTSVPSEIATRVIIITLFCCCVHLCFFTFWPDVKGMVESVLYADASPATAGTANQAKSVASESNDSVIRAKESQVTSEPLAEVITNSIGMQLKLIPAGEFMMGSGKSAEEIARRFHSAAHDYKGEHPQHRVQISRSFYLQQAEVTQAQWKSVMGSEPWKGETVMSGPDSPATFVSWEDAVEFCQKLSQSEGVSYRLPTEAEWEYACRAGQQTMFSFGDNFHVLDEYAWYDRNADADGEDYAHRVGRKRPNRFGLFDMHGNVWEWCSDRYDEYYYRRSPSCDPTGPPEDLWPVIRGGSWLSGPEHCRSAYRSRSAPGSRDGSLGFRVLRSSVP